MIAYLGGTFRVTHALRARSVGLAALGAAADTSYTEYAFDDGYTYQQFSNGDILIVKSTRSSKPTMVKHDDPKQAKAWTAINNDIQKRKAEATVTKGKMSVEDRNAIIKASGSALSLIITSVGEATRPSKKKGKKKKGKKKKDDLLLDDDAATSIPYVPLAIGGGVLLLLGVLAASRGGKAEK